MKSYKVFTFGFISALLVCAVIFSIIYANWAHAALLSRVSSQTTSIQIVNQEGGSEKLKQIVSLTLVSDYCAIKSLGEYFFISESTEELVTLSDVKEYITSENFTILCEK